MRMQKPREGRWREDWGAGSPGMVSQIKAVPETSSFSRWKNPEVSCPLRVPGPVNQVAFLEQKATQAGVKHSSPRKQEDRTWSQQTWGAENTQEACVQVPSVTHCLKIWDISLFQASFLSSVKCGPKSLPFPPLRLVKTSRENTMTILWELRSARGMWGILTDQAQFEFWLGHLLSDIPQYETEVAILISRGYFKKKLYKACKVLGTVPDK